MHCYLNFVITFQGSKVLEDFNIEDEAGGPHREINRIFTTNITDNTLEIHFYWGGKGTTAIPYRGVYGPLISAISVTQSEYFTPPYLLALLGLHLRKIKRRRKKTLFRTISSYMVGNLLTWCRYSRQEPPWTPYWSGDCHCDWRGIFRYHTSADSFLLQSLLKEEHERKR